MHIAIAVTLFLASATSALGLPRMALHYRLRGRTARNAIPPLIAAAMMLWFFFVAFWMLRHG